ncbi:hypothetical protein ACIPRI_14180 [Variovorax sp. LARHSF232]
MTRRHGDATEELDELGRARRRQIVEQTNQITELLQREAIPPEVSTHQLVTIAVRLGDAVRRSHFTSKDEIIAELTDLAYQLSQSENTRPGGFAVAAFIDAWTGDKEV